MENQLSEMNAIKERTCQERQRWFTQVAAAYEEIVALKKEQQLLLNNANEWVASFPDPSIVTRSVQSLCKPSTALHSSSCHAIVHLSRTVFHFVFWTFNSATPSMM